MERNLWAPYADGDANPELDFMRHLKEPLRVHYRPLGWYLLAEGLALVKHTVLTAAGFACSKRDGFLYYTYGRFNGNQQQQQASSGEQAADQETPLFFAHGVGLGLLPYLDFVLRLAALGRPVIAIEYPHLAMRWARRVPSIDEGTRAMLGILDDLGVPRAAFVGHSFGTFFCSRVARTAPARVAAMTLIDPVTMCMWSGDLVRSFVYKPREFTTWWISRDACTMAAVSRGFHWCQVNMWGDQVRLFGWLFEGGAARGGGTFFARHKHASTLPSLDTLTIHNKQTTNINKQ
jgi:pimeloyl-ACP methyl ester carboxylesterase